jgi:peroxiredoxin
MALPENKQAPDFSLFNTEKKEISLKDQRGKNVLLLFFPLAFTGTCTKELCSVRDNIADYNSMNATVFGISVDSLFSLKKFREEQNINFDLLSDFNKDVSKAYDCLYTEFINKMRGVSKRSAYIIDKDGIIRYSEVLETATDLPDFNAIKKKLQSLG